MKSVKCKEKPVCAKFNEFPEKVQTAFKPPLPHPFELFPESHPIWRWRASQCAKWKVQSEKWKVKSARWWEGTCQKCKETSLSRDGRQQHTWKVDNASHLLGFVENKSFEFDNFETSFVNLEKVVSAPFNGNTDSEVDASCLSHQTNLNFYKSKAFENFAIIGIIALSAYLSIVSQFEQSLERWKEDGAKSLPNVSFQHSLPCQNHFQSLLSTSSLYHAPYY